MLLIDDVRAELKALDFSRKNLRKFGLTVGAVFLLLAIYFGWKKHTGIWVYALGDVGLALALGGLLVPSWLKEIYRLWMALALTLGWVVSRILLGGLFYLVLTPIGMIARLCGKNFLDRSFKVEKNSYWVKKENTKVNYEKMS